MEHVVGALSRLRRFAQAVKPSVPRVDEAIVRTRALLEAAGVEYKVVGGIAVIHHGYERLTTDVDVLVEEGAIAKLLPLLGEHGFEQVRDNQLRDRDSGVLIDVLVCGVQMARPGAPVFPDPRALSGSESDPKVVSLLHLLELKLHARRFQDLADVVELLKHLDDSHYTRLEATIETSLRPRLWQLRQDALEELAMES